MRLHYNIYMAMMCLLGLSACQNEEIFTTEGEGTLEFYTSTQIDTRTSLQDGRTVVWNQGDAVAVYDFAAPKRKFVAEINGGTARFRGNITPKYGSFIAAYPYDLAAENDASQKILMYLPAEQTAVADGFGPDLNLSIAKGERNVDGTPSEVRFRNVCQLFKFGVPSYAAGRIVKIELTANKAIAGQLTVDYTNYDPIVTISTQGTKTIALFPPTGTDAFTEGEFYFVVAPEALDGFTLNLTDKNGTVYTQHSNSTVGGVNGFIYNLGNVDLINKPVATSAHVYDNGTLVGTQVSLTAPVPDKSWSAVIKNAVGETVRTLSENTGTLTTDHTDANWPYLPKGNYTVEYTYTTANGKQMNASSTFSITEEPQFTLRMTANSTYSYYQAGNVDKANSMNANAVDGITSVIEGVSTAILSNERYTTTRANNFSGTETGYTAGTTTYGDISIAQLGNTTLSTSLTFDGVTKTASKDVYITGLPFSHQPPTSSLWSANNGQTSFESDYVRTGAAGSNGEFSFSGIQVPAGTKMALAYKVDVYMDNALSTQRYQITVGNQIEFDFSTGSTGTKSFDESKVFTNTNEAKVVKCYTGYCYGRSHSKTYKIALSYSN